MDIYERPPVYSAWTILTHLTYTFIPCGFINMMSEPRTLIFFFQNWNSNWKDWEFAKNCERFVPEEQNKKHKLYTFFFKYIKQN